jgi:dihydroorotase/N-acyl-D-amino-acid deacylase
VHRIRWLGIVLQCWLVPTLAVAADYDLILANGRVVDGTGAPWFRADVGIRGDRIIAIGPLEKATATRRIDVSGRFVAPGFIDMLGQSETYALVDNRVESKIRQGITTEVTGEGSSVAPYNETWLAEDRPWLEKYKLTIDWKDLDGYWRRLRQARPALNIATFVGAAQVRGVVVGLGEVAPDGAQLGRMQAEVETAMKQGALGVSSALIYPPGSYAKTPELVALARTAGRYGGVYASHIRGEDDLVLQALEEAISIGRQAQVPVEIWHLKVALRANWGRMKEVVARIERARAEGVDVAANIYPYLAASNGLAATVPEWAQAGGNATMIARFRDPATRKRIVEELGSALKKEPAGDILLVTCVNPAIQKYMGKRLDQAAREMGKSPEDALLDLLDADNGQTRVVRFWMSEDDLRLAMRQPWVSFVTDNPGQATDGPFAKELAHPRAFGSMTRVLARYVRDEPVLRLEDAVRKMTSLPARRVRLFDRGLIRSGMAADLVVFDLDRVKDVATYEKPLQYSEGITQVVVNGRVVLDEGRLTEERPGRPLMPARP